MKYNERAQLDTSQVSKRGGGGGRVALGGGAGLIVIILALVFGLGDPGELLNQLGTGQPGTGQPEQTGAPGQDYEQCKTGADAANDPECRLVAFTNSIQGYWAKAYPEGYQEIVVQHFSGSVATACGNATSAVGPFYCPGDSKVYIDLDFYADLTGQLGAQGGDAAEAYVLAHEFGHHLQNLLGTMQQAQTDRSTGPKSAQVRLELQADCYAGTWFSHATNDPNSPITEVTQDDLNRAIDAASAVGDDRIQEKTQGQVSPESWTHGSAAQRQKWLMTGFESGDPNQCDTFAAGAL